MAQTGDESKTEQLSVSEVPTNVVITVWPQIEPHLVRALRHGQGDSTTPQHVLAALLRGDSQMWVAHEDGVVLGFVIFRVNEHDTCRKIWIDFVGGREMRRWGDQVHQLLLEYAELIDAKCIEGSVRKGFVKVLERMGARQKAIIMESTNE